MVNQRVNGKIQNSILFGQILSTFSPSLSLSIYRLIEPFQNGETPTYFLHVKNGVEAVAEDPYAVLVFSGCVFPN